MEVKALWGFVSDKGQIKAGETVTVTAEEGHTLIGKGLAVAVDSAADEDKKPKNTKQAAPKENK